MAQNILTHNPELMVIGGSAGSLEVILKALPLISKEITLPIILVFHRKNDSDSSLIELLAGKSQIPVLEAAEKDPILPGHIYVAPADYHLLIENDHTLSLDYSEKVNFSRPCIDVTFQTAAEVYQDKLVCLLLSGASTDGTNGLHSVKQYGGIAAVQDPLTADVDFMPRHAMENVKVDRVVNAGQLGDFINTLGQPSAGSGGP